MNCTASSAQHLYRSRGSHEGRNRSNADDACYAGAASDAGDVVISERDVWAILHRIMAGLDAKPRANGKVGALGGHGTLADHDSLLPNDTLGRCG